MKNKTLVVGTGVTGCSVMRFLHRTKIPFDVYSQTIEPKHLQTLKSQYSHSRFYSKNEDAIVWNNINQVIVSPGIPPSNTIVKKAISDSIPVNCDLELFSKAQTSKPIIAITGTNGKSTLVTLLAHVLKQLNYKIALAGNIGQAMLDSLEEEHDIWLLELSSFQLHYQNSLQADVACILNITEDHIDWHGSYENYQKDKQKIYNHSINQVFNNDDLPTQPPTHLKKTTSFSLKGSSKAKFSFSGKQFYKDKKVLFHCDKLNLTGRHNYENVLAALTILEACGMNIDDCLPSIKQFSGLPHRTEWIRTINGIKWINDSKGTNVGATLAALKGIGSDTPNKIIWLAGGQGKGADFSPLTDVISSVVKHAILFGEDKQKIAQCIAPSVTYTFANSMEDAITQAQKYGKNGDNILLSPACASFDMFENYIKRGEVFSQLVNAIN